MQAHCNACLQPAQIRYFGANHGLARSHRRRHSMPAKKQKGANLKEEAPGTESQTEYDGMDLEMLHEVVPMLKQQLEKSMLDRCVMSEAGWFQRKQSILVLEAGTSLCIYSGGLSTSSLHRYHLSRTPTAQKLRAAGARHDSDLL